MTIGEVKTTLGDRFSTEELPTSEPAAKTLFANNGGGQAFLLLLIQGKLVFIEQYLEFTKAAEPSAAELNTQFEQQYGRASSRYVMGLERPTEWVASPEGDILDSIRQPSFEPCHLYRGHWRMHPVNSTGKDIALLSRLSVPGVFPPACGQSLVIVQNADASSVSHTSSLLIQLADPAAVQAVPAR